MIPAFPLLGVGDFHTPFS